MNTLPMESPLNPMEWDAADAGAIQALLHGTAEAHQQQRALDWIIRLCGTYDLEYRPGSERDSAFASGKRFVGLQIVKMTKIDPQAVAAAGKKVSSVRRMPINKTNPEGY